MTSKQKPRAGYIRLSAAAASVAALFALASPALAQTTSPSTDAKTPSGMPPGAKSTTGNKAATPASGASASSGDMTGASGMPPGAKSGQGNKAMTPKGSGPGASGATR